MARDELTPDQHAAISEAMAEFKMTAYQVQCKIGGYMQADGAIIRERYDPEQPRLSTICQVEEHDKCDEFGWMPWCECECHAPASMTPVCYHGRHDLCPKQPSKASGLARCSCECHEEGSNG